MLKKKENTIKVISPAKVNLFLAVGENGDGVAKGYHPVLNVMHGLLLHDVLYFNYEESKNNNLDISIEFIESQDIDLEIPKIELEDNLIYKALTCLANKLQKNISKKIDVIVEKNIPAEGGLAGGSSNAAAALLAGAKIFGISKDHPAVLETAQEIGKDVAFFLEGGCALYTGGGEILDHKIQPINREVLLVKPVDQAGDTLSTKRVYQTFDKMDAAANLNDKFDPQIHNYNNDEDCDNQHEHTHDHQQMSLYEATKELSYADNIPLFNNLAYASEAIMPKLSDIKSWLASKVGVNNVLLAGSGSVTFAIVPDDKDGEKLETEARSLGYWTKLTQLANTRAKIIPIINEV